MDQKQQRKAARQFAKDWKGRGYEKGDTHSFWLELLRKVVGVTATTTKCKFEYHAANGGFIDCYIPDSKTLIEQKALGVDLDKPEERQGRMVTPYQQALSYAESFPLNQQPRFIIVSDFGTFRIHDRDKQDPEHDFIEFALSDLPDQFHLFNFMLDPKTSRSALEEQVSMQAGELIGKLHKELLDCYIDPENPASQHSLNVLCVRLVFCLFCEDADLFDKDAFLNYLKPCSVDQMRPALKKLFKVLNTPPEQRDPYDGDVNRFPYINGGLFAEEVEIPNFTENLRYMLLFEASQETDWSRISPTIFGGIFESTLNPETRRQGGMHYTSPENIHKVIDPLFMDALKDEFNGILIEPNLTAKKRKGKLKEFRNKIGSMRFFDPACGSGNFLTETYLCLRELEDDVLNALNDGQMAISFDDGLSNDERVSLDQFYGIEINDFAVRVAKTALWIAQLQADRTSEALFSLDIDRFPLSDTANVFQGNALRMDWNEVLSAERCDYVMGNPPFIGHQRRTESQQEDMDIAFKDCNRYGKLDYVCAWYIEAARYVENTRIHAAFVSTNSICQGESVRILWEQMFDRGVVIDFAHTTFVWNNEATDQAHVHVVIVGFSNSSSPLPTKTIYYLDGPKRVNHINGYLVDADDVFIANRGKPVNPGVSEMTKGSQPTDGGNLILSVEEKDALIEKYPNLSEVIHPYIGGREFINGGVRYCLWFVGAKLADYNYPEIRERLQAIADARNVSPTKSVREAAATPALFTQIRQPDTAYLGVPEVSSERRKYIPVGFVPAEIIASNQLRFIPTDSMYVFGLLLSKAHMAWMRVVSGRLKSDYRYAPAVYNSFVFPDANDEQRSEIEQLAQGVLDARALYPEASLADLYDPDNEFIYPDLISAHKALDAAVEAAYGVDFNGDEEKIVAHLFKLYAQKTAEV